MAVTRLCSIPECRKPVKTAGLCNSHYLRKLRHGDPLAGQCTPGAGLEFIQAHALQHTADECLLWPYGRGSNGYGYVHYQGKKHNVSRLVCQMAHGTPPTPKHEAAHSCGNGHMGCVAANHVRWATRHENNADKQRHGAAAKKLTVKDVRSIRRLADTAPKREIAARFGVSREMVYLVIKRKSWDWVP